MFKKRTRPASVRKADEQVEIEPIASGSGSPHDEEEGDG
jgi:hypothetical protein